MASDTFPLPRGLLGDDGGYLWLLKMPDDSMAGAWIADGDWVIVRQQADAEDGDLVAAMIGGETTVRTLIRDDGHVRLVPDYQPVPGAGATVIGKVTAVIRRITKGTRI